MKKDQAKQMKKEWKDADDELKEIIDFKRLEKWLKRHVGKKCKTYACGCYACDCWHAFDALQSF